PGIGALLASGACLDRGAEEATNQEMTRNGGIRRRGAVSRGRLVGEDARRLYLPDFGEPAAPRGRYAACIGWSIARGGARMTAAKGLVLVEDDEPAMRKLIAQVLGSEGYRVETADSGATA